MTLHAAFTYTKHNFPLATIDEAPSLNYIRHVNQASAYFVLHWPDLCKANADAQIQYKVEGRVQGVNFRSFTQKQARSIGITGFVTNASDGSVSICPQRTPLS